MPPLRIWTESSEVGKVCTTKAQGLQHMLPFLIKKICAPSKQYHLYGHAFTGFNWSDSDHTKYRGLHVLRICDVMRQLCIYLYFSVCGLFSFYQPQNHSSSGCNSIWVNICDKQEHPVLYFTYNNTVWMRAWSFPHRPQMSCLPSTRSVTRTQLQLFSKLLSLTMTTATKNCLQ